MGDEIVEMPIVYGAAPTVAAQQCGTMDEVAMIAARYAYADSGNLEIAIRAYLEAATPPDVAGLVGRLEGYAHEADVGAYDDAALTYRQAATALRLSAGGGEKGPEALLADEILAELVRARTKFPGKNVTFAALVEEVGELATATFEESRDRVRKEAVQVAVMAMRMVLDGDHTFDDWRASKGLDALAASPTVEGA